MQRSSGGKRAEIDTELEDYPGFIDDVDGKDDEIEEEIKGVLLENDDIKALVADIEALKQKYPFLLQAMTVTEEEDEDADADRR